MLKNRLYLICIAALATVVALSVGLSHRSIVRSRAANRNGSNGSSPSPVLKVVPNIPKFPAASLEWQAGSRFGYDFDFDSRLEQSGKTSDWLSLRGSGTLLFDVIESSAAGVRLRGAVSGLSTFVESNKQQAESADEQFAAELAVPFSLEMRADGRIKDLAVVSRVSKALGILRLLVGTLQFVRPATPDPVLPNSWTTNEEDDQGRYSARYEANHQGFRKVKLVYTDLALNEQFSLTRTGVQAAVQADTTYSLDSRGHVAFAEANSTFDVPLKPTAFRSRTHVLMKRAKGYEDKRLSWDRDKLQSTALYGASTTHEVASTSAERKALIAGASFDELAADMDSNHTTQEQWSAMSRLSALFDERPDTINLAKKALLDHTNAKRSELLLGALASATGASAQKGLTEVANSSEYDADTRQAAAIQLGLETKPTANTVQQLSQLATNATDPTLRNAATLALGTAAGRTHDAEGATTLAKLAIDFDSSSSSAERTTLVTALGNAGSPNVVQQIKNGLTDSDESVRAAAVLALRLIPGPEVDQLIADRLLQDDSVQVRIAAATAAQMREASQIIDGAAAQGLLRDPSASVKLAIIGLKVLGIAKLPQLAAALVQAKQGDATQEVRDAAAKALSTG